MDINTTFDYWLRVARHTDFKIERFSRPFSVAGVVTPDSLNNITIGQLIELSTLKDEDESLYRVCEIVLRLPRKKIANARAVDVVMFCGWVTGEVERINKVFEGTNATPTDVEKRAGIEKLRFGLFGMLDWYALRMGYQDQEQVKDVPWMRVYKCMEMDVKRVQYQKRLQEVINDEYRRKNKGGVR